MGHCSEFNGVKPEPSFFLCHHAVFRLNSESTKLRVVFDGSNPSSSGFSVNNLQLVGPNIQDSIFSILLRFLNSQDSNDSDKIVTKRLILSQSLKIFDVLGILCPFTIQSKILIQKLWILKLDWNDPVPNELKKEWEKIRNGLLYLQQISVPRLSLIDSPVQIELHSFSDASMLAYGALCLLTISEWHFLIGRPLRSLPSPNVEEQNISPLRRYARLEQIRQHFWQRWQREYISELQQRSKWRTNHSSLQIGDLVLIQEDNTSPLNWALGRVSRLYPGADGISRVADLETLKGRIRRPFARLCPLPKGDDDQIS
ncbi:unnamed protein product [Plutella xylostella]|uniref:(diamondback moth) hypothetical protein n=1 Tax=Plutella xylostella TaxID=51655 RepID=A0A8S4DG71_PLUXY|nr:unnamed protein product [Plutella xylostella]